jgi:hypothetical protein
VERALRGLTPFAFVRFVAALCAFVLFAFGRAAFFEVVGRFAVVATGR